MKIILVLSRLHTLTPTLAQCWNLSETCRFFNKISRGLGPILDTSITHLFNGSLAFVERVPTMSQECSCLLCNVEMKLCILKRPNAPAVISISVMSTLVLYKFNRSWCQCVDAIHKH